MISVFKQFWLSLRDPNYGQTIVSRSFKNALWYWTRIFLVFVTVPAVLSMFALTYFSPQLPRYVKNSVPEGFIGIKSGQLHSSLVEAWQVEAEGVVFRLDPFMEPDSQTDFPNGVTILKDRIVFKDQDTVSTQSLSDLPDFQLSKTQVSEFISRNLTKIWIFGLLAVLVLALIIGSSVWLYRLISFFSLGVLYLVMSKIMHKNLAYMQLVKMAVYTSVISFIFSALLGLLPSGFSLILNAAIVIFYGHRWLKSFPSSIPPVAPASPPAPEKPIKPLKPKTPRLIA